MRGERTVPIEDPASQEATRDSRREHGRGALARTVAAGTLFAGLCIAWLIYLGGGMVTHPDVQEIVLLLGLVALAPLFRLRRRPILLVYCFVMIATGVSRHVTLFLSDTPAVSYFTK